MDLCSSGAGKLNVDDALCIVNLLLELLALRFSCQCLTH